MKKRFTGPVWLLLIVGLFQAVFVWQVLLLVTGRYFSPGGSSSIGAGTITYIVMWPVIIWLEALVYWLIRRRNEMRLLSWTHAVIFCFAFLVNDLVFLLTVLHSPLAGGMHTRGGRAVAAGMFWALIVLAHAAFVQVLMLAFRKPKPIMKEGGATENILDDVVL